MTELDFYQQRILGSGVFNGATLIQASGEIGGTRHVFVKLQTSSKNGLVYPTVGGVVTNPFKGNAKIYAGDLLEYDPGIEGDTGATVRILKTYEVAADATTTEVQIVRDGYHHKPFVGDFLMKAPSALDGASTATTVTAVEKTTDDTAGDVWKLTLSTALTLSKGDILVEAAAGSGDSQPVVTNPNSYAPSDFDFLYAPVDSDDDFEGARYLLTPCLANPDTVLYTSKMSPMPASVLALNKSRVNGWFML